MTLTLPDLRHLAYDDPVIGPALGYYSTATTVTGLSLTDADAFGSSYGVNHFAGKGLIVLPNRSGSDREKMAGRLSGSVLTLDDSTAYTTTYTNEPYEFIKGGRGPEAITITRLNTAAQDALRMVYFDTRECVSQLFPDGGCNSEDLDGWNPSSVNVTIFKSADPAHNLPGGGLWSLLASYIGANEYVESSVTYGAQKGDQLWVAALPIVLDWGTVTLQLWDVTNNRQIGQTLTATGKGPFHLGAQFNIPEACEVNVRLGASEGIQVAWDSVPNHASDGLNFAPPSWVDANWKLYGIDEMHYGRSVSQGAQRAISGQPQRWQPRIDYTTGNMAEDAGPGSISVMSSVHKSLPMNDLFYIGRRRESDHSQLLNEDDVTNADLDYLLAAFLSNVCEMLEAVEKLGPSGTWMTRKHEEDSFVARQRMAVQSPAPQPRQVHRVVSI